MSAGFAFHGCNNVSRSPGQSRANRVKDERPNILWISCEDISPDLGCYGDDYANTPNLDNLAGQGCLYTNAFAVYPVCAPNRSSVITGMYPGTIGTMHMRTSLKGYEAVPPPYVKCFTEYLRAAGYYCTNQSKTDYQFDSPFTAWDECSDKAHWRNRPEGMPFFSVINLTTTHESTLWAIERQLRHDPAKAKLPPYYPDTPIVRRNWARYYDRISLMDIYVDRILRQLKSDGLEDNTIVFFWSDHGRGLPRGKRWVYDSGIHIPLIVRWPGEIKQGSVCRDLVSCVDFGETVLSIAGVPIPSHMQGRAFLGAEKMPPREYIFAGRERMSLDSVEHIRCVRDKRYKYIRNFMPEKPYYQEIDYAEKMPLMQEIHRLHEEGELKGPQKIFFQKAKPPEEFYDLEKDPYEINNIIESEKHAGRIVKMRKVIGDWIASTGDLGDIPEEELIERFRPGGVQPQTAEPVIKVTGSDRGRISVRISCSTEGASIGYRLGSEERWKIYAGPVTVKAGTTIYAKAIRIGYKESKEVSRSVCP